MLVCVSILLLSYPVYLYPKEIEPDTLQKYDLEEVVVNGVKGLAKDKIGSVSISGTDINNHVSILGEHDVIKAIQTTSGVVAGTEGFAGLYVRGGETDQNLYLLDGLPLLNIYHLGGLFSTFSTLSIERADFYKGVFPPVFSERGSSIVDIMLRKPNLYHFNGSFSVGLISGQLYFSSPVKKGRSALSVALRRTWFDVFSYPAITILNSTKKKDGRKTIFNYNFTDVTLKFSSLINKNSELSFLLFYGKDNFKLGEERFYPEDTKNVYQRDINKMSWGNWGASFNFSSKTAIGDLKIQPYVSKAFASDKQENMDNLGIGGEISMNTETKPAVLQVGMREIISFPVFKGWEGEISLQQAWHDYFIDKHYKNALLSAAGELKWDIHRMIEGAIGIRGNNYLSKDRDHWTIEPRFHIKVNLPYASNISLGYSRISQNAQQVSSNYIYLPSDAWLPTASYNNPMISDIFSLGYFKTFRQNFSIKGEVWFKNMDNIAEYKPNTYIIDNFEWYDKITYGKGTAYGMDLEATGQYKTITWNMTYGLMWNWRKFSEINSGKRFPAKFDNRHKINISLGWEINPKLELTGQWEYVSGNLVTLALYNIATPGITYPDAPFINPIDPNDKKEDGIDYYGNRNNVRLPATHRLNLNLSLKGQINQKISYKWDFGLYNAYCRMNPFTVTKSYINVNWNNEGKYRNFKTLSLIPILPSVSFTINF